YLDARAVQGRWLVRIEDLDPPREDPTAAAQILHILDAYGLHWDGEVRYQSLRNEAYQQFLDGLIPAGLAFPCQDRKSTRLNSSHVKISYAVFCLKKKNQDIH